LPAVEPGVRVRRKECRADFGPRPVPGRSTLDSCRSSRGSPYAAGFPRCCAPGRRAARVPRTATGPRSQHVGFMQKFQRFAVRCWFPQMLRAGTSRGPYAAARWDFARVPPRPPPFPGGRDAALHVRQGCLTLQFSAGPSF